MVGLEKTTCAGPDAMMWEERMLGISVDSRFLSRRMFSFERCGLTRKGNCGNGGRRELKD